MGRSPMCETKWRQVDRGEFESFVRTYPHPLEMDVCAIGEPPLKSYNDFGHGAVWPESMVAKEYLEDGPHTYFIRGE